jgi:aspartyl-tRNA(Asn)/glutamyl-tRNA(Gln) amidotransferase subunit A
LDTHKLTISEASSLIRYGQLSPSDLLEGLIKRIDRLEPRLRAWVTVDREGARARSEELTREAEEGNLRGPLHGIPVGVKDIYYTAGLRTTMGSPIYRDFVPLRDADAVAKLREAGAVVLGKTETTEFALSDPAPTRNPWNPEHTPGGSSSGSAVAVSSGTCPATLGTQTGGSIIRPAAFCGVVGMKPTYDLISRRGVYPLSWSLDHVGFFTRTVEDAGVVLGAQAGGRVVPVGASLDECATPKLGILRGYFKEKAEEGVWEGFKSAVERLGDAGAELLEIPLPEVFGVVHAAHRLIMASEAASVHEELFRERRAEYRVGIRGLVSSGLLVPAHAYVDALRIRGAFIRKVRAMIGGMDSLVTPSAPTAALRGLESTGDPSFNAPWSLCGFPVITVPSGLNRDGLPLGVQLTGLPFQEIRLLRVAAWCEDALGFEKGPRSPL